MMQNRFGKAAVQQPGNQERFRRQKFLKQRMNQAGKKEMMENNDKLGKDGKLLGIVLRFILHCHILVMVNSAFMRTFMRICVQHELPHSAKRRALWIQL